MSATAITVQQIGRAGITPSFTAANTDGNFFDNNGRCFIEVKNTAVTSVDVTLATPGLVDGLAIADRIVSVVGTTGDKMVGPLPTNIYNDASGRVNLTYSHVTNVVIGVFRL